MQPAELVCPFAECCAQQACAEVDFLVVRHIPHTKVHCRQEVAGEITQGKLGGRCNITVGCMAHDAGVMCGIWGKFKRTSRSAVWTVLLLFILAALNSITT